MFRFPTETDDDFADTMTLCQKYRFPSLFVNQVRTDGALAPVNKLRRVMK